MFNLSQRSMQRFSLTWPYMWLFSPAYFPNTVQGIRIISVNQNHRAGMSDRSQPFTIRLSKRELELIRRYAPNEPIGRTVRQCVFQVILSGNPALESLLPPPKIEVAGFLSTLGVSDIVQELAGTRAALEVAGLETEHSVFGKLDHACADIHEMKTACIRYLGVRPRR